MKNKIAAMLVLLLMISAIAFPVQAVNLKKAAEEPTMEETTIEETTTEETTTEETTTEETTTEETTTEETTTEETATEEAAAEVETVEVKTTEASALIDAALVAPELEKRPIYENRTPASARLTADTVTIDEESSVFSVLSPTGTEMTVTVPFGAYCITQDIYQQLEHYLSLYKEPSTALQYYISNGIHMDIFDFCTGTSTYIAESDDTLAALIGDLNTLNDKEVRQMMDYISKTWYAGCPATLKTVGKNKFIAFDLTKEYGFVVYNHFTNGKLIEVYTYCDNGTEGKTRLERMIKDLTFGAEDTAQKESPKAS